MYLVTASQLLTQQNLHLGDQDIAYLQLRVPVVEVGWCLYITKAVKLEVEFLMSFTDILDRFEWAGLGRRIACCRF
jgi:hypothetical protein